MKRKIYNILLVLFIGQFIACSNANKNNVLSSPIPSWYLNAPSNSTNTLYGTGEAQSLDEAKKDALRSLSESLIISLKSSFSSTTKTSRDGISNTYLKENIKNIESKTKNIDFSNYKVEKAINQGDRFYVLVSVSKAELFKLQEKELNNKDKNISFIISSLEGKSLLEKIYIIKQSKSKIVDAKDNALILNAIDNTFDYSTYHTKYDNFLNKEVSLKENIIINIKTNAQGESYKEYLTSLFNGHSFKTSNHKYNVIVNLKNNIRYSQARAWHIAKVASSINVESNKKNLSNHTINTIGRSSSSKANAKVSSSMDFNKKIKALGIDKILFGK